MLKIIQTVILVLLISACGSTQKSYTSHKPFQTVQDKDAILVQTVEKESCIRCGMNLIRYYKTSHTAQSEDTHYQYCSIHCLEEHLGEGIVLKNPRVVDISSLKLISVMSAYYVVGSSKAGTMTRESKYAFKNIQDAKEFKNQYGGEIMSFEGARKSAKNDFKHYRN